MQTELLQETQRQAEICNACRYCEGYCSVFPAMHRERAFTEADLTQFANLCHNCRGCYYACQYTAPHEFDLNLPKALAELRRDSWESYAWPGNFARLFHSYGTAIAIFSVITFALLFLAIRTIDSTGGEGFYAALSHSAMVAIFMPAFLFPLISIAISLRVYWRAVNGQPLRMSHITGAFASVAKMKNLAAGHGDGCNFEDEDRFSHARRYAHQAVMYGFLLCFASTCSGTVMHYVFDLNAPYAFFSLPKLLGVPGGILMTLGAIWMIVLKFRSDRNLADPKAWNGEVAFILLLGFVGASGLALYALGKTDAMPTWLALHLGSVLSLFLLTPYSKMAHGFYRLTALIREEQNLQPAPQPSTRKELQT